MLWEHVLLDLPDLALSHGVDVLGWQDLLGGDWLDSVLVVVNVPLSVDGLGGLDVLLRLDGLLGHFWGDLGADLEGKLAVVKNDANTG